jgi:hypothetical protein
MALQWKSLARSWVEKEPKALEQALRGFSVFDMSALRSCVVSRHLRPRIS